MNVCVLDLGDRLNLRLNFEEPEFPGENKKGSSLNLSLLLSRPSVLCYLMA